MTVGEGPAILNGEGSTLFNPFVSNGAADSGHPTVGIVEWGTERCTATLVGPKTVLTATSCVPTDGVVFVLGSDRYQAAQVVRHAEVDLAVVLLDRSVSSLIPSPLGKSAPQTGQSIILVGYGKTSEQDSSFGTKRTATNTIASVAADTFTFAGASAICEGDAGGPTFIVSNGVEVVAGVHTPVASGCGSTGTDVRIDAYREWVISSAGGDVTGEAPSASLEEDASPADPSTTAPEEGATSEATEGKSCASVACASGLACTTVFDLGTGQLVNKYCMVPCTAIGSDAKCNGGEICSVAPTGIVCFNAYSPETGYTSPGTGSEQTPSEPTPVPDPTPSEPTPVPEPTPSEPAPAPVAGSCGSAQESGTFDLMNKERKSQGLSTLACDSKATAVARAYSQDMCNRGFFSHTNPEGLEPWDRLKKGGVSFSGAGENIAQGYPTPAAVHQGWMNSSGHRQNILTPSWKRAALGYSACGGQHYWTQVFMK